jgi:plasmid stabilization system protein ParE
MRRRYVLAPEAALDLVHIWRFIRKESSEEIADRVEAAIRDQIVSLAKAQASVTGARTSPTKQ